MRNSSKKMLRHGSCRQQGKSSIMLIAGIALFALLLHWALSGLAEGSGATLLQGAITLLAVFISWLVFAPASGKGAVKSPHQEASSQSAVENVLMQTHPQFASHFAGASGDLEQVQALLADAIEKLLESFSGMQNLIKSQQNAALGLVGSHKEQDSNETGDFLAEISATFQQLIVTIVNNSKVGLELVEKMDVVTDKVSEILAVLADIDGIAKQTNLLALNAAIEAARAG